MALPNWRQLRQLLGSEEEQRQDEDEDHFLHA